MSDDRPGPTGGGDRVLSDDRDAELLRRARDDPEAFGAFYDRHVEAILAFFHRRTGNTEVALDLTSEVFAAALDGIDRYRPDRGVPRAWLFGIAKVKLLASYHRQAVEQTARRKLGVTVVGYSEEDWEQAEARIDASLSGLIDGLEKLSPAERDAVVARVVHEREYADIARAEQASEAAIRQRVSRGLRHLAALMKRRSPR